MKRPPEARMPVASVSRIEVKKRHLLPFFLLAWRSLWQARRAPGHVASAIRGPTRGAYWTLTVWTDITALRAYRNAHPHRHAMRRGFDWSARVASARWDVPEGHVPSWDEAERALADAPHTARLG